MNTDDIPNVTRIRALIAEVKEQRAACAVLEDRVESLRDQRDKLRVQAATARAEVDCWYTNPNDYVSPKAIRDLFDDASEFVRASPVAIEKVKGDKGYTVLLLVENDDWSMDDRVVFGEHDHLLVPVEP